MRYVDGFVLPVPKKNLKAYFRMAKKAGRVWRDHGAVEYRECAGDDLDVKFGVSFLKTIRLKPSVTVVFSWIVYKSHGQSQRTRGLRLELRHPRGVARRRALRHSGAPHSTDHRIDHVALACRLGLIPL